MDVWESTCIAVSIPSSEPVPTHFSTYEGDAPAKQPSLPDGVGLACLPSQAEISGSDSRWIGARRRGRRRGCRNRTLAEREAQVDFKRSDKNTKERVRVGNINRMYHKLRRQLGDPHPEKRLCKLRVLNAAIQHIHDLMDVMEERQNGNEMTEPSFLPLAFAEEQDPSKDLGAGEGESTKDSDQEMHSFLDSAGISSEVFFDGGMAGAPWTQHKSVLPELTYNFLPACGGAPPNQPQPFLLESRTVPVLTSQGVSAEGPLPQFLHSPPSYFYQPPSEYYYDQSSHHLQTAMVPPLQPVGVAHEGSLLHQPEAAKFSFLSPGMEAFLPPEPAIADLSCELDNNRKTTRATDAAYSCLHTRWRATSTTSQQ